MSLYSNPLSINGTQVSLNYEYPPLIGDISIFTSNDLLKVELIRRAVSSCL